MLKKAIFPGQYLQGEEALAELPGLIALLGKKPFILASPTVSRNILPGVAPSLAVYQPEVEVFRGECCEEELSRIGDRIAAAQSDVVIGMGGGKTLDTAKIVADRAGVPSVIVPTIASTDAPTSACAVIYSSAGVFESVWRQKANPAAVVVDLGIIAAAPVRFLVAGMGDALSTWFEARSCDRTQSPNECGGLAPRVGLAIAKLCYETLLSHGVAAKAACEQALVTPALDRIVEANTLLSGIGFESAGLASAHSIHNGLTMLEETHDFYHGEKVAFGVLSGLVLTDAAPEECDTVYGFCESVGLPTTLEEVGLGGVDAERLMLAAMKAADDDQPIHHEAGVISPKRVLDAMLAADALGRKRKV